LRELVSTAKSGLDLITTGAFAGTVS